MLTKETKENILNFCTEELRLIKAESYLNGNLGDRVDTIISKLELILEEIENES